MQGLDELYREVILDHYRDPHGADAIEDPTVQAEGFNPLCGDEVRLQLSIEDGHVAQVSIAPSGCAISVASASMLAQQIQGKPIPEALRLEQVFRNVMRGSTWPPGEDFGDLEALEGVKNFPVRIKCALLAWMTFEQAVAQYDPEFTGTIEPDEDIEVQTSSGG